jgi:hypothetical protein
MATLKNTTINDTGYLRLPPGTTAQRPAVPAVGMIRYNTTLCFMEQYTCDGWQGVAPPPVITSISPTSFNGESGTVITVNGANFDQTASGYIDLNGGTTLSPSTVRNSASQIEITVPRDVLASESPASIRIVNGSGLAATLENGLSFSDVPVFTTTSTSLGIIYHSARNSYSLSTAAATDSNGGSITGYSIVSGSVPSGLSFNTSTAAITGTANSVGSDTTSSFTVRATDNAGNTTDKAFSITVKAPVVQSFTSTGSSTFSVPTGISSVEVLVVAGGGGGGASEGFENGGGGGAGGYIYNASVPVSPGGSVPVTVGAGGSGANPQSNQPPNSSPSIPAGKGGNSSFGPISATGGGIGGGQYWNGQPGGSGGGDPGNIGGSTGGSGISGQGNPGGGSYNNAASSTSGGGGGASNSGARGTSGASGAGGSGANNAISGSTITYAGGGGGAGSEDGSRPRGTGGSGGGGNGGNRGTTGSTGTTNRGGGGGGGVEAYGGGGGPGIVIVKY